MKQRLPRFAWRALEIGPLRSLRVKYFLEIFAGTGRLGAAMSRRGSYTLLIDIEFGPAYDVTKEALQVLIRGWIASGFIEGLHLGLPCDSFSRARDRRPGSPPLRSDALPLGLPDLRDADRQKVERGNRLLKFSVGLLVQCSRRGIPATLENPWTSRVWITPSMKWLVKRKETALFRTDFCMWGRPHRKATYFLGSNIDLSAAFEGNVCQGAPRGLCARTGRPHHVLAGTDANGQFLTKLAEPYPINMCNAIARTFGTTSLRTRHRRLMELLL